MYRSVKQKVHDILWSSTGGTGWGKIIAIGFIALITLNVIVVVFETDPYFSTRYKSLFTVIIIHSVLIFTVEYILRLWSCNVDPLYQKPVFGRLSYALTPLAIIDFISVAPFYIVPVFCPSYISVLHFCNVIWILKLGHYSSSIKLFGKILRAKKEDMFIAFFILFILLIISSALMYLVEHAAQPDKFSSIFESMWWGIQTLATIGYGDIYPITPAGKFLGSIVAMIGIGLFALPAGIFASGFVEELHGINKEEDLVCPYCGKEFRYSPKTAEKRKK